MSDDGYAGQQRPAATAGEFNASQAIARMMISRIKTATLVKIVSCTNSGDLSPVGFVDVQPLVNQLDGNGKATPHNILHRLPYFRLQGGTNAIIIDPQPGDIGIAIFADRDIQAVNNTKAQANPGSNRRFDMADGLYVGGVLNGTPVQYIQYNSGGITMHSPTKITLSAPAIEFNADNTIKATAGTTITSTAGTGITETAPTIMNSAPVVIIDGALTQGQGPNNPTAKASTMQGPLHVIDWIKSDTEVTAVTTPLHTHQHTGVATGGSNTGGPTP